MHAVPRTVGFADVVFVLGSMRIKIVLCHYDIAKWSGLDSL